jgi:copper chaperone CopZ
MLHRILKSIQMKKILSIIAVLVSLNSMAQFTEASLQASGLTCSMCSKAIYKALEKVDFVDSIRVDIKSSTYRIFFDKDANVDFDALSKAVTDAGFSVASLKVTGVFTNTEVKNDAHVTIDGKTLHFLNVKSQTLNGTATITLLDKNFVSAKDFKKNKQYTTARCYDSGKAASCCKTADTSARIFHATI